MVNFEVLVFHLSDVNAGMDRKPNQTISQNINRNMMELKMKNFLLTSKIMSPDWPTVDNQVQSSM